MRNLRQIRAIAVEYARRARQPIANTARRARAGYRDYLGATLVDTEKDYARFQRVKPLFEHLGMKVRSGSNIIDQAGNEIDMNPAAARKATVKGYTKVRRVAHEGYRFARKHPVITSGLGLMGAAKGFEYTPAGQRIVKREEAKKKAWEKKHVRRINSRAEMLLKSNAV